MSKSSAVIIATEGLHTRLLVEVVEEHFDLKQVFIEPNESKLSILKRRLKKPGFFSTTGQVLFMVLVVPFLRSKNRITEILDESSLKNEQIPSDLIHSIQHVNETRWTELLVDLKPDLIFINGTRILSKASLNQFDCPVYNIHAGITPEYRGVHGGYWALYDKNSDQFGVTLHRVDEGIDTGIIVAQKRISPEKKDNYATYPLLQYCEGLKLIIENKEKLADSSYSAVIKSGKGRLHYHPRFCQYLHGLIFRKIR